MNSWTVFSPGLKFVMNIHPTDDGLSLHYIQPDCGGRLTSIASMHIHKICATNSSISVMCLL